MLWRLGILNLLYRQAGSMHAKGGCSSCDAAPHTQRGTSLAHTQRLHPHPAKPRQQLVVVCRSSAAARPPRWMKVVEAHEYTFLFGYNGASTQPQAAASSPATAVQQLGADEAQHITQQQQQLAQEISNAEDWTDLLQLAAEHGQLLTPGLQLRLMFRLFVSLYEVDWQAAHMADMLADTLPPLLGATAANLSGLLHHAAVPDVDPSAEQQQRLASQLADMLYALAVLAAAMHEDAAAAAAVSRVSQCHTITSGGSPAACRWYQCAGMQQLLDAVGGLGSSWDMRCVSRKDAVSLLWAYGKLLQLQQQPAGQRPHTSDAGHSAGSSNSSDGSRSGGSSSSQLDSRARFISLLCSHITLLIQCSNNTADPAAAAAPHSHHPSSSAALTEPWHPEDLTDAVTGLAAAVAGSQQLGQVGPGPGPGHPVTPGPGFKSQAAASLLDAVAHEVYRQLSNRHSTAGTFTAEGVVALLQAYCDLEYQDGPSLRMFDAAAGWVVKRVRARHTQAPSSPQQLAAVAGVFARLQHRSVVVPELLNALGSQACKAAAAAVELAADDPWSYHAGSSSSYCHWLPQHAASLLQAHMQLGYRPPGVVLTSVLTALTLHWEHERAAAAAHSTADGGQHSSHTVQEAEHMQLQAGGQASPGPTAAVGQQGGQQQVVQPDGQRSAAVLTSQQLEQQVAAVEVLDVLAQLQHHPGNRVLSCMLQAAWAGDPHQHLSLSHLVTLLFSSVQLAALSPTASGPTAPNLQPAPGDDSLLHGYTNNGTAASMAVPQESVAAVAYELILSTMPEQEQRHQERLSLPSIIRVLWSLCAYGSLDIAQYGWLLVAVAAGPWQRLSEEQLLVIKQGQLLLGEDGADMATEVLPGQLLTRVEAAWAHYCKQHGVGLPQAV